MFAFRGYETFSCVHTVNIVFLVSHLSSYRLIRIVMQNYFRSSNWYTLTINKKTIFNLSSFRGYYTYCCVHTSLIIHLSSYRITCIWRLYELIYIYIYSYVITILLSPTFDKSKTGLCVHSKIYYILRKLGKKFDRKIFRENICNLLLSAENAVISFN